MSNKLLKLSFVVMFLTLSCTPYLTEFNKEFHEQILDFTYYSEKGFLFTPEQYNGDFESCGLIVLEFWPKVKRDFDNSSLKPGQFYSEGQGKNWVYTPISSVEILDSLYLKSKRLGADAMVKLYIEEFEGNYGPVTAPCKRVSGYAIKRK